MTPDFPLIAKNRLLRFAVCLCLVLGATVARAQIPGTDNYDPNRKWSVAEQLADYEIVRLTLEEVHPGLYRYQSKAAIDSAFARLKTELSEPLTDRALNGAFARFFYEVRCGHSYHLAWVRYYRWLENNGRYFPLEVRRDGNVLYLHRAHGYAHYMWYAEIVSMNGRSTAEILSEIDKHIAADGNGETYRQRMTEKNFSRYYHAFIDTSRTTELELRPRTGSLITRSIPHLTLDEIEAQKRTIDPDFDDPHYFTYRFDARAAFLKIRSFGDPDLYATDRQYRRFLRKSFRSIRRNGTKNLILDLRGNEGGSVFREELLLAYLFEDSPGLGEELRVKTNQPPTHAEHTNRPDLFRYPDELLTPTDSAWYEYQGFDGKIKRAPRKPFTGQLFLLVDGGTYSAAADLALKVKLADRGIILGEETGGVAGGSNSGVAMRLRLPNTKGTVIIPLVAAHNDLQGRAEATEGVVPDIPVLIDPLDFVLSIDPAVMYIERFLK